MAGRQKKVFVAMSGGVDSSVAAGLLQEQGYDVVGVTMCFHISYPQSRRPSCCGVEGIDDARRAAQILNIPHYVLDFATDINDFIIGNFTSEYLQGRTPNPCVRCNQHLKFGSLYQKCISLGGDCLATGHYARIEFDERKGCYVLRKACDTGKDQSYFLYSMQRETLSRVMFPLGGMRKDEVRQLARRYALNTADKPESQDICFVPDGGYKQFIRQRCGDEVFVPGPFKNHKDEVVGEHRGIVNYTIGQRDKLGLALGYPVYVYRIDAANNTVYVGPVAHLYARACTADQFNPLSLDLNPGESVDLRVRIRYNSPEADATLTREEGDRVRLDFCVPQKAVTPGQSAVFYHGDEVLGGALIRKAMRCSIDEFTEIGGDTTSPAGCWEDDGLVQQKG